MSLATYATCVVNTISKMIGIKNQLKICYYLSYLYKLRGYRKVCKLLLIKLFKVVLFTAFLHVKKTIFVRNVKNL